MLSSIEVGLDVLRGLWQPEMQELDSEDWEDIWDYTFQPLVVTRDKPIKFKI